MSFGDGLKRLYPCTDGETDYFERSVSLWRVFKLLLKVTIPSLAGLWFSSPGKGTILGVDVGCWPRLVLTLPGPYRSSLLPSWFHSF